MMNAVHFWHMISVDEIAKFKVIDKYSSDDTLPDTYVISNGDVVILHTYLSPSSEMVFDEEQTTDVGRAFIRKVNRFKELCYKTDKDYSTLASECGLLLNDDNEIERGYTDEV